MNEKYDDRGNLIYYKYSDGYWYKYEYDKLDNRIYYENSDGDIDYPQGKEYYYENRKRSLNIKKLIKKYTKPI